ncbi:UTP--glucose-1-phosphate uridylyltransferase [Anaerobacillus sp. MEB173]|uniref:UTP--glucose-1-phosphate uridylyltransferase n=1 Tax=Anaerobacillus sp. MEB173 TaxID=3383345 RepID=UPI003F8FCAAB
MSKIKKAVIPAAGYGTRSLPITKVIPKEMFPICGRPAIHYIVEEAALAGIKEILIVVSRNKNMILDYFDASLELEYFLEQMNKKHLLEKINIPNVNIQYVRQPYAKGLGDAVRLSKSFVGNEPFAILLPDDIFLSKKETALEQLMKVYDEFSTSTIAVQKVKREFLKNYGVIKEERVSEGVYNVVDIVEKPLSNPPSDLAVCGRYILEPEIFSLLEMVAPDPSGELQLTDALKQLVLTKSCIAKQLNAERFDIGSEKDYINLIQRLNQ